MRKLVIATRRSRLALWQAEHEKAARSAASRPRRGAPRALHARRRADRPAARPGGRQGALRQGARAGDGAGPRRARGAFNQGRPGRAAAGVCTGGDHRARGSARRFSIAKIQVLLAKCRPGRAWALRARGARRRSPSAIPRLEIRPLRGNVDTRLARLDRGDYDAIVLAAAGLEGPWPRCAGNRRISRSKRCCRRRGRGRSASSVSRRARKSPSSSRGWQIATPRLACAPSAR